MESAPAADLTGWYLRYNAVCNSHRFDLLADYVHRHVVVNGEAQGLDSYVAGLESVVTAFPDYRWDLQHLVISGEWLAAHFLDSGHQLGAFCGVSPTGRWIETQEFAFYRVASDLIVEVWVAADNLRLLEQIR
jgi:aspartyl-tRNA synthetase